MTTSTSFAQMTNNQSISLSSALRANTPPTKGQTTSRKFLTLSIFFLLSFFCTTNLWGAEYSYTFTSKQFTANGSKTLNSVSWTLAGNGSYWGYDGTKGQQFGSGSAPYKTLTLSTSGISGTITKIIINTSGAKDVNASFTVSVGGTQYGSSTKLTTLATDYTFNGSKSGEIKFSYTQTSSKALYIKSISVTYETAASHTVTWKVNDETYTTGSPSTSVLGGSKVTQLPTDPDDCSADVVFVGWTESTTFNGTKPSDLFSDVEGSPAINKNTTFHAVFATKTTTGGDISKQYSFDITKGDFNTTSYVANNNSKTSTAKASDNSTKSVSWTSNQVMQQSSTMQWQSSKGYIYNTTDLGNITDVTITSTAGTFTTYYGTSQQPSQNTSVGTGNGYFQIKVGSATGKVSNIKVTFTQTVEGETTTTYSDYITTCAAKPTVSTYIVKHCKEGLEAGTYPDDLIETETLEGTIGDNVTPETKNYTGFTAPSEQQVTILEDGALVVTYKYTRNSYTLTWNLDGGTITTAGTTAGQVKYGATLTAPTVEKTNFQFESWTPAVPETMPADAATYTAQWTPETYEITLNTNDGTINSGAISSYTYGVGATLPTDVTKTGYTFAGWYNNSALTGDPIETIGNTETDNKEYWAKWTINKHTLTWNVNEGNPLTGTYTSGEVEYGAAITKPKEPTREGYCFIGWHNGTSIVTPASTMPDHDLTYTAKWTKVHTITWNVLGAETGTTTIVEGQEWTLPEVDESCNDKQFVGWTITEILEEQNEAPATLYTETNQFPLETNTYYAVFANVEVTGTGEYVKVTKDLPDYSGEYLIVYETGSRAFNGGLEKSSLDGNDNYIPITISDNVVQATDEVENARFIVAKVDGGYYSIQSASGLYIGRSANSNGTDIEQTYNEDLVNTFPNCSTIRGKGGADLQYNNNTHPSQQNRFRYYSSAQQPIALYKKMGTNMTNYTTSCVPTYTITWENDDDTVLETDKVKENTTPTYDGATPTKAADAQYTYTFNGWDPAIAPATTDATYTATYTTTVNKYTITWKNGDYILETDTDVEYGATPTYNGATPTKAATAQYTYSFKGWNPEVMTVTGNATYTATFTETINQYQVTFNMNSHGTAPETQTIEYGSKVSKPSDPTADGYEFAGWYKDAQCTTPWDFDTDVITGNTTIHAKWLQIFTITWKANGLEYTTTNATEGEPITPPASPDAGDYCGQVFAGWTDAEMAETSVAAPTLYPTPNPFPKASADATFYAVFADYDEQQ